MRVQRSLMKRWPVALLSGLGGIAVAGAQTTGFAPLQPSANLMAGFIASLGQSPAPVLKPASVPVLSCPADGQTGPIPAPKLPRNVTILASPGHADRLAYYKAEPTGGALAPRGWKCFARYGSNGASLTIIPPEAKHMLQLHQGSTAGPVVELAESIGGTSGRYEVAAVAARVFPVARKFAESVRDEGVVEPQSFVFAPWPGDVISMLSDRVLAYRTSKGEKGLGASDAIAPSPDQPIQGVAFLSGDAEAPDLTLLRVRLGKDMDLYPTIAANALPPTAKK